jgi:hypothetical protein
MIAGALVICLPSQILIRMLISLFPMLASFANVGEDFHIKALTSINRDG